MPRLTLLTILTLCLLGPAMGTIIPKVVCSESIKGDIYGYSSRTLNGTIGTLVKFSDFKDQVVLITNVATYNDLTTVSYHQLNELAELYVGQPFVILAYPTSDFHKEEPSGVSAEIYNALKYVRPGGGYVPQFQLFKLTSVNGGKEEDIFTFLKGGCFYTDDVYNTDLEYSPLRVTDVRQVFEKFLVGKDGKPHYRYHASLSAAGDLVEDINELLAA